MTAGEHLAQPVAFGGRLLPLGVVVSILRAEGHDEHLIDRWVQGALTKR